MARRKREQPALTSNQVGRLGEETAAQYLVQRGYTLLRHNWRCEAGEVDLIMRQNNTLVFIEVKSGSRTSTEEAALRVDRVKQRRLVRCLYQYLEMYKLDVDTRVDVIAISFPTSKPPIIEHREDILDFDLFSNE